MSIKGPASHFFTGKATVPFAGKNAFIVGVSVYIAVRSADIRSATTPISAKILPVSVAAVAMFHLLTNPQKGGIPVSANADTV